MNRALGPAREAEEGLRRSAWLVPAGPGNLARALETDLRIQRKNVIKRDRKGDSS